MADDRLAELVALSNRLGDPLNDFVILGEGNTSTRCDEETFYLKASGTELRTITAEGFVRVRFDPILALLQAGDVSDEAVKQTFAEASVDAGEKRPSVEALMHAVLLQMEDVEFVAHTHPTAVNIITCSRDGEKQIRGRLFPDEIVCCGIAPVWVPYTDPGIPLARKVRECMRDFVETWGVRPKVILIQNHGLVTLGATASEVENATHMMCKTARVLAGTCHWGLGGPHFLTEAQAERIHTRPDEHYRAAVLERRGMAAGD